MFGSVKTSLKTVFFIREYKYAKVVKNRFNIKFGVYGRSMPRPPSGRKPHLL